MSGYNLTISLAPFLIPLVAALVIFLGRRTDEDEKGAMALGVVATLAALVAWSMHSTFNGYGLAISAALTAVALFGYLFYRRREAY